MKKFSLIALVAGGLLMAGLAMAQDTLGPDNPVGNTSPQERVLLEGELK